MKQIGYSPQDIADQWGVHRKTVLRIIRRGELPAVRIGPQNLRIMPVDAAAYYSLKSTGLSPVVPGSTESPIESITPKR